MQPAAEIAAYLLAAVMAGVSLAWTWLVASMLRSFARTPRLGGFPDPDRPGPRVSVILPARNEEAFIGRCLDSLSSQDYDNCEIIAIDDSSEDGTARIIREHAGGNPGIVHVSARPKPEGWTGKNWACMEGYRRATGSLLLFTDSDTKHAPEVVSLAVSHLLSLGLDALTVMPRILCPGFWTRVTVPVISTFLHTQFSALKVNDPSKKTGYFFGSFFIIRRDAYEGVGTHEGVRQEIIEDGALGGRVKGSGYRMRMVRGDDMIEAVWARDGRTLWHALKRLMVPLYLQSGAVATGVFFAVLFLLFVPFPVLAYSAVSALLSGGPPTALFWASLAASALAYAGVFLEARQMGVGPGYAALGPLGGITVASGFLAGLVDARLGRFVHWRGRRYQARGGSQNPLSI